MKVALHADASRTIGTGHVMRCLALARELAAAGHEPLLAADEIVPELAAQAAEHSIPVMERSAAPTDADWIVVDGYQLDPRRIQRRAPRARLLIVDDHGGQRPEAELVLNQNLYATPAGPSRVPPHGELLAGPCYALLGSEFAAPGSRSAGSTVRRVLVTMGGSDPSNATAIAIAALASLDAKPAVRIVVGPAHPAEAEVRHHASLAGFDVIRAPASLAAHIVWADLIVSACGTSILEIARLGRPVVGVVLAENQRQVAVAVEEERLGIVAGRHPGLKPAELAQAVARAIGDRHGRAVAVANGPTVVDGLGARRVASALETGPLLLRDATHEDADRLLAWRNDPATLAASFDQEPVATESHRAWLAQLLASTASRVWIGELGATPVGVVRFALERDGATISVTVDPDQRAIGLGLRLISAGCARLIEDRPTTTIDAWIRRENAASERAFRRAGFRIARDDVVDRRLYRLPGRDDGIIAGWR